MIDIKLRFLCQVIPIQPVGGLRPEQFRSVRFLACSARPHRGRLDPLTP